VKVALDFIFFAVRCGKDIEGEVGRWTLLEDGPKKGSNDSSSGLVQLPPRERKDPMLSQEDMEESEKPEEDVGLLDDSL